MVNVMVSGKCSLNCKTICTTYARLNYHEELVLNKIKKSKQIQEEEKASRANLGVFPLATDSTHGEPLEKE